MSKVWTAKDPDAVLDYVYRIPLDPNDSIAAIGDVTFNRLGGTAVIGSKSLAAAPDTTSDGYGQDFSVWLSGGADDEIDIFKIEWTTVQTRTDDDIITLPIVSKVAPALALTGYAKPAPAHLVARYPDFGAVSPSTIQYWLTDAERSVDTSWGEGDYATALMALAAHNMALAGIGGSTVSVAGVPAGVTNLKSGALSISMTPEAANALVTGGYGGTPYGQEFETLLRRNRGGPLVSSTGVVPTCGYYPWSHGFGGYGWPG